MREMIQRRSELLARLTVLCMLAFTFECASAQETNADAVRQLREISPDILSGDERAAAAKAVSDEIRQRLREANVRSTQSWKQIDSLAAWQRFRAEKIQALRDSLGVSPERSAVPASHSSGVIASEGFVIEKLLFESRPGLWVTANLYRPEPRRERMPGILICHSHHNPKTENELQTMGATWARAGCLVLVMDQLGHGERREHPFRSASDYPREFRAGRQDYYFRYDTSLQLYLIGDSLMGWMVRDLMCGVDVLLAQVGADPRRIALLGAVAGGGDPAAVAAALDSRITVAVPFNFGGPQPETTYPLPDNSEETFSYAGSGSWESTRNLRLSAADGFLPWVIVGSIAPRRLVYAHEFRWDRERDPVWKRFEKIYAWHDSADLAFSHGAGKLSGQSPEATHCNNIGAPHRKFIHAALQRWWGLDVQTEDEYRKTLPAQQLLCWTPELREKIQPATARQVAASLGNLRSITEQQRLLALSASDRRDALRTSWKKLLGDIEPGEVRIVGEPKSERLKSGAQLQRLVLATKAGVQIPILLFTPEEKQSVPLVIAVSQQGKAAILRENANQIEQLLRRGVAVCLPDLPGMGETGSGDRERGSRATSLSASELMLGGTVLGARLRDLRSVLRHLSDDARFHSKHIGLWGTSSAPVNTPDAQIVAPHAIDGRPKIGEPGGGLLALLGALYEDGVQAVYTERSLSTYASALHSACVHLPHDVIVPGAIAAGDVPALVSGLTPIPVWVSSPIDGTNRAVELRESVHAYATVKQAYRAAGQEQQFSIGPSDRAEGAVAAWFAERLAPTAESKKQ